MSKTYSVEKKKLKAIIAELNKSFQDDPELSKYEVTKVNLTEKRTAPDGCREVEERIVYVDPVTGKKVVKYVKYIKCD